MSFNENNNNKKIMMIKNELEKRIHGLKSNNFDIHEYISNNLVSGNRIKAKALMIEYKKNELALKSIEELVKRLQHIYDNIEKNDMQPFDNLFLMKTLEIEVITDITEVNKVSIVSNIIEKELEKASHSVDISEEIIESELIQLESKLEISILKDEMSEIQDITLDSEKKDLDYEPEEIDREKLEPFEQVKAEKEILFEKEKKGSELEPEKFIEIKEEAAFGSIPPAAKPQASIFTSPPGSGGIPKEDSITSRLLREKKPTEIPKSPISFAPSPQPATSPPPPPPEPIPFEKLESEKEDSRATGIAELNGEKLVQLQKLRDDSDEDELPPEPAVEIKEEQIEKFEETLSKKKKKSKAKVAKREISESLDTLIEEDIEEELEEDISGGIMDDIALEESSVEKTKKIYSQVSYYDRVIPFNNYPLIVKLSHSQMKKQRKKTNIFTGERQISKDEEIFETDVETVEVVPICPGCLVSPTTRIAPLNISYNELDFTVAPLVNGKIDARVEIRTLDRKLIHQIDIPCVSKQSRLAKTIAIVGSVIGIVPSALDYLFNFNINDVAREQLSQDFPVISDATSGINLILVAELVIFVASLSLAGFLFYRMRPKKASKGSEMTTN